MPVITPGPSITNPATLQTIDELRTTLHDANGQLVALGLERHMLRCELHAVAGDMAQVVVAFMKNDHTEVSRLLADIAARQVGKRTRPTATASTTTH